MDRRRSRPCDSTYEFNLRTNRRQYKHSSCDVCVRAYGLLRDPGGPMSLAASQPSMRIAMSLVDGKVCFDINNNKLGDAMTAEELPAGDSPVWARRSSREFPITDGKCRCAFVEFPQQKTSLKSVQQLLHAGKRTDETILIGASKEWERA